MRTPLPLITAMARSGALDRAWALFEGAGYDFAIDDPAALAVRGRLLKDRGLLATGAERLRWLGEAAKAYAAADAINAAPYLRINVATLTFLAGDRAQGAELARSVIALLGEDQHQAETPYWLAATRAEANMLIGDTKAADTAFGEAIKHSPDSWSDHASTLRQLKMIADDSAMPSRWMDRHRPPKSMHFAGHLGVADGDAAVLRDKIDRLMQDENIGFGYGALAAGADVIIAEALLARDAELHVVLPVGRAAYFAQSVDPYGADWRDRFENCIHAATSIQEVSGLGGKFEPLAVALGGDYSMGAAILNARMLESSACQIIVADEGAGNYGSGRYSARDAERWHERGHAQHVLRAPRTKSVAASGSSEPEAEVPSRRLLALLHISLYGTDALPDESWPLVYAHILSPLRALIESLATPPLIARHWAAHMDLAFEDILPSFEAAQAVSRAFADIDLKAIGLPPSLALTISGHFDIAHFAPAQSGSPVAVFGSAARLPADLVLQAHPGTFTVTSTYANALAFQTGPEVTAEYVGDQFAETGHRSLRLYSIRAR